MTSLEVYNLDNDFQVVLKHYPYAPVVAFNLWIGVGSAAEQAAESGLCHFIEHMLFKGTRARGVGELAREIEAAGGEINAYTSFDETVYLITMASRDCQLGLQVLADAVRNSLFEDEEIDREREVILEEIRRSEDLPARRLGQRLLADCYTVHPYGRPVLGVPQTVGSFQRDDILRFFRRWYTGSHMTLVVVGDFHPPTMKRLVSRLFGPIRRGRRWRLRLPREPQQRKLRSFVLTDSVQEAYFELAFHIPNVYHPDLHALDVCAFLLGQGETSRLVQEVKHHRELVDNIYAYAFTPRDPGLFVISSTTDQEKLERAVEATWEVVQAMIHRPVSAEDLDRARTNLESDFIFQKETVQGMARNLGYFLVAFGDASYEEAYLQGIRGASEQALRRAADRYFRVPNMTLGALVPRDHADAKAHDKSLRKILEQPSLGRRAHAVRLRKEEQVWAGTLRNQCQLLIMPIRSAPVVSFRAVFPGGVRYESPETSGICNLTSEMLTRGTARHSYAEMARAVESLGGAIEGFSGRNSFGISADFPCRSADRGLELMAETLREPAFDEGELAKVRQVVLASLKQQEDHVAQAAFNRLAQLLYDCHPYGLNPLGRSSSLRSMRSAHLSEFYSWHGRPDRLVIAVVGDVDVQDTLSRLGGVLEDWPPSSEAAPLVPEVVDIPERRLRTLYRDKAQAHLVIGFLGTTFHHPDRYTLQVLNAILSGQGGRLFLELRDRMGLAYSVSSFVQEGVDRGSVGLYIGTSADKLPAAKQAMWEQLEALKVEPVSHQELRRARRYIAGTYEIDLQRSSTRAARMALAQAYGLGQQEVTRYVERVLAVEAADVQRVARKYLDFDRSACVVVRPRRR